MEERLRVLFLSDHLGYAEGITHGATTYFLNVLPKLKAENVELTVCFLRERHEASRQLESLGITPVFLNRSKWDPRALTDLMQIIRDRRIQIVHAAGMKGILLGRIAARLTNCRSIIHLHDTNSPGLLLGQLQRMMAHWSDLALVVSRAVGELASDEFRIPAARVKTMYNPLDVRQFEAITADNRTKFRAEMNIAHDAPVVGITGRLSPEKGHEVLIRIMPKILSRLPKAVLLIVGDGVLRERCEAIVEQLQLQQCVRFSGFRQDVPDALAAMDVVVMPSSREGLSYSLMEAMAAERPVVAFAIGGMRELIVDGYNGLLIEPGNADALTRGILEVLENRACATYLANNAHKTVSNFSIGQHVTELKLRYRTVLNVSKTAESVSA